MLEAPGAEEAASLRTMIVVRAACGKPCFVKSTKESNRKAPWRRVDHGTYDCIVANPGRMKNAFNGNQPHHEVVVVDPESVLPTYVITYRLPEASTILNPDVRISDDSAVWMPRASLKHGEFIESSMFEVAGISGLRFGLYPAGHDEFDFVDRMAQTNVRVLVPEGWQISYVLHVGLQKRNAQNVSARKCVTHEFEKLDTSRPFFLKLAVKRKDVLED